MSGEATNEIYIFFTSRVKLKPYSTQNHLNFLFIIYNPFSKEVHFTFFKLSLFLTLSNDNEHESMLKGKPNKVFLIQLKIWCYKKCNVVSQATSEEFDDVT